LRINDTYQKAYQVYQAQVSLEEKNKKGDYTIVLSYSQEMQNIAKTAFKANDEIKIFEEAYKDTTSEKISELAQDYADLEQAYNKIKLAFQEERFEDSLTLIDEGYAKLSEVQSKQTTARLLYSATTRTLKNFIQTNWKIILTFLVVIILILIVFQTAIRQYLIKKKINNLYIRKDTLNSLVKKLQNDYFKTKKISETEYHVKTDKFKEMIRDIDRQIPLLKEDLAKVSKADKKRK
jgi:hypothetical protein